MVKIEEDILNKISKAINIWYKHKYRSPSKISMSWNNYMELKKLDVNNYVGELRYVYGLEIFIDNSLDDNTFMLF